MPVLVRASGIPKLAVLAVWAGAIGACASGQALQVTKVSASAQPPANVALYLKVTRPDGQPATLLAADFKVYEDGKIIPSKKLKRALLPASVAIDRYVLVAVDLSGPLADSEYLSTLQDTVSSLAERLGKDAHLALSVFDGDGLKPFLGYDDADVKAGLAAMRKFRPHNRNVDLWGSFIEALGGLDEAGGHSTAPYHQTSLILMTDRRDKAGRHSRDEVLARVQASASDVYVIGIGDAINKEELTPLGKSGAFFVDEPHDLDKPFVDASEKIEAKRGQDYIFSYCSTARPSKRGKHKLEVKIVSPQFHGSVDHEFSTRGFVKGPCDPRKKPEFGVGGGDAADADAGDDAGGDDAGEEKSSKASGKKSGRAAKKKAKAADDEGGDEQE